MSVPLKIAHMRSEWLPTTENWLHTLLVNLPSDIESHVVCDSVENIDEFKVDRLHETLTTRWAETAARTRGLGSLVRKAARGRALANIVPHIVHSHFGFAGSENAALAAQRNVPHIVSFYGFDVSLPNQSARWRRRYSQMFDQVSAVLCEGPHMAKQIAAIGAKTEKIRLYRLGIDLDRFPYRPRAWSGKEPIRVLIAGRFVEKKGIPFAIDALARIAARVPLEIHLVGDDNGTAASRAEKSRIERAIEEGRLNDRIIRHGAITYPSFLKLAYESHVLVSPSVHARDGDCEGGAPISIIQMAASGMPIVSTEHCDIPYAMGGHESAFFAPERNVGALVDQLLQLVEEPGKWRSKLDRARAHVEKNYDARTQGRNLADIYRDTLEKYGE